MFEKTQGKRGFIRKAFRIFAWATGILVLIIMVIIAAMFFEQRHANKKSAERVIYWKQVFAKEIPTGSSRATVEAFFKAQAIPLNCKSNDPKITNCYADDPLKCGSLPSWRIIIDLTYTDDVLSNYRVRRYGVGL
jgi:hypothetical protein